MGVKKIVVPLTLRSDEAASLPAVISTAHGLDVLVGAASARPGPEAGASYPGMLPAKTFEKDTCYELEKAGKAAALTSRGRLGRLGRKAGAASAQTPWPVDALTL